MGRGVASNLVPRAIARLVRAGNGDDLQALSALHEELMPLFNALFLTSNPIPVKAAGEMLGHATPHVRLPLVAEALDEEMARALRLALDRALRVEASPS